MDDILNLLVISLIFVLLISVIKPIYKKAVVRWLIWYSETDLVTVAMGQNLYELMFRNVMQKQKALTYRQLNAVKKILAIAEEKFGKFETPHADKALTKIRLAIDRITLNDNFKEGRISYFYLKPFPANIGEEFSEARIDLIRVQRAMRFNAWLINRGLNLLIPWVYKVKATYSRVDEVE
jgi:hypothetical protein